MLANVVSPDNGRTQLGLLVTDAAFLDAQQRPIENIALDPLAMQQLAHNVGQQLTSQVVVVRFAPVTSGYWDSELPSNSSDAALGQYRNPAQLSQLPEARVRAASYQDLAVFAGQISARQFTEVTLRSWSLDGQEMNRAVAMGLLYPKPFPLSNAPKVVDEAKAWGNEIKHTLSRLPWQPDFRVKLADRASKITPGSALVVRYKS